MAFYGRWEVLKQFLKENGCLGVPRQPFLILQEGLYSKVFCSGYEKCREPADKYDAILGTARTTSSKPTVTYKISIETDGFKNESMCEYWIISNDYSVLWPKGDNIFQPVKFFPCIFLLNLQFQKGHPAFGAFELLLPLVSRTNCANTLIQRTPETSFFWVSRRIVSRLHNFLFAIFQRWLLFALTSYHPYLLIKPK